jgi:hypothetical protein
MTISRTLPFAAASVLLAATASADLMSRTYFVPVVARNAGAAGSTWRTELCISNPHDATLTVRLLLHQGDTNTTHAHSAGPLRTDCSADVLLRWFGLTEFQGGLSVWERVEWIPGESQRQYLLSAALEPTYGSVAFINHGTGSGSGSTIYPFVTVTDNTTGDGRFIGASQVWIGPLVKTSGGSDAER